MAPIIGSAGASKALDLQFSPNPASESVTITLGNLSEQQDVTLEIYNNLGQLMMRKSFGSVSYLNEQINLSGFGNGVYTASVKAGSDHMVQKLVVNRY